MFIGDSDGLSEANKNKFTTFFYTKNKKYQELKDDNKFIVSGRKGTGKTILAKYYESQEISNGNFAKYIDKDEVLFNQLQTIGNCSVPENERAVFISYSILLDIGKLICENKKKILKDKGIKRFGLAKKIRIIKKIVNINNFNNGYELNEYSLKKSNGISGGVIGKDKSVNLSKCKERTDIFKKSKYYNSYEGLKCIIFDILTFIRVTLIIDDLDEYGDKITEDSDSAKFLAKFIEITYKFNLLFKEKSPGSKIILIFRSDLFILLHSASTNLNKYTVNSRIVLDWLRDSNANCPENHLLIDMILTKVKVSVPEFKGKTNKELFENLFPKKIKGVDTLKYLLGFSQGRPRDIVNLLNMIIERYPDNISFENNMFLELENEYSKSFCDELRNEMSLYYSSDYINECIAMITYINKKTFWISDAKSTLEKHQDVFMNIKNVEEAVNILYKYGFVGNIKPIGNKYSFGYKEDGRNIVRFEDKFTVHYAVRKHLF